MKKVFIAWVVNPVDADSVKSLGEFDSVESAESAIVESGLVRAEVETEYRKAPIDANKLAAALNVINVAALNTGLDDGRAQGFELSCGMTYDDLDSQWAYDVGTYIGACFAVRG